MLKRKPLVLGEKTFKDVTEDVTSLVERIPGKGFFSLLLSAKALFLFYIFIMASIVVVGMGLMGVNHPVGWGTDIITFVFWIGIGHAGTLISAILFLFRQKWRTSIARTAEAMTVFAVFNRRTVSCTAFRTPLVFPLVFSLSQSERPFVD